MSDNIEFLEKLYDILENPLYSKIIDWNGDHIFEIKNLERFNSVTFDSFQYFS